MENQQYQNENLALIWNEGPIYNIEFESGINEWKR